MAAAKILRQTTLLRGSSLRGNNSAAPRTDSALALGCLSLIAEFKVTKSTRVKRKRKMQFLN